MLSAEPFNPIGSKVLLAYVMPIAMVHMETKKEGKGSGASMDNVIDNLVDASVKVYSQHTYCIPIPLQLIKVGLVLETFCSFFVALNR
jgi:hypothetical protein